jgi:arylsulfatase A-like enzyme/tetratricopeptide (TPR) repeat protein
MAGSRRSRRSKPRSRPAPARPPAPPRTARPARRWVLPVVVLLAVVGAGLWWWQSGSTAPGAVVLVSIDTLRADHLAVYGYTKGRTPVLDAFARDGVVFDHAYAQVPLTLPSHTSILTGLLPFEHKVRDNVGFTLAAGTPTLASLFHARGYRTGGFVSAYVLRPETGIAQGFDVYDAKFSATPGRTSPSQIQRPGPETLAAAAAWLDTLSDDRFFLFFHLYEPHAPYTPPARFASLEPYDGEVAYADEIVGQLFDRLKARGWYRNATIVLLGDHGEGLGDHGEAEHGLFLYNDTLHVPLIVKLPGDRSAGRRVSDPVQHIDLLPTLAHLSGLAAPTGLRGRDLTPALTGAGGIAPEGIYSETLYPRYHFGWSELTALTDDRYRFIKAPRPELYDLARDPRELTNLVADRPQVVAAMRGGLDALVAGRPIEAPGAVSPEDRAKLAALGYIGQSSVPVTQPGSSLPDPKDKVSVLARYHDATVEFDAGNFEEAARGLKSILADNPGMTDVWEEYASALLHTGREADALEAYKGMVRSKPDEPGALLGAASVLIDMGRLDEARTYAELAVAHAPAAAHRTLTDIALAGHHFDEALRQAALTEQADPTQHVTAFAHGRIEYDQGHYDAALPYLLQARQDGVTDTMASLDLGYLTGDTLARLTRYPEAETALREDIRIHPGAPRSRLALAGVYHAMGRTTDADQVLSDLLQALPSPATYEAAARLYETFGEASQAASVRAAARARWGR